MNFSPQSVPSHEFETIIPNLPFSDKISQKVKGKYAYKSLFSFNLSFFENFSFNNLLISNPKEEVIADQIIDEIGKNFAGEQVYLLSGRDDVELANYTKKQLEKQKKQIIR